MADKIAKTDLEPLFKVEVIYPQTGTSERPGGQQVGNMHTAIRITQVANARFQ